MTILTHAYAMLKQETNPEFARQTLLDTYERLRCDVSATADALRCSRGTVYLALKKKDERNLLDASHAPKIVPNRSSEEVEALVMKHRKKTRFGKRRLRRHIFEQETIMIPESTIGAILKRKHATKVIGRKPRRRERPASYDLEALLPFSYCQMDTKEIADAQALPPEVYEHFLGHELPRWQWTFIDVRTRMRFLAWSHQRSWANGQVFVSLVRWWLASYGFSHPTVVRIDGGTEWHANYRNAFERSQKDFYYPLWMFPELIRKGQPQDNAYVERSHGTDDTELYIPHLGDIKNEKEFLARMAWWQKVYNLVRPHSGKHMHDRTPYEKLQACGYSTPPSFAVFPTLILDRLSASPTVFQRPKSVQDPVDYDQK